MLSLILALAACGGNDPSQGPPSDMPPPETPPEVTPQIGRAHV